MRKLLTFCAIAALSAGMIGSATAQGLGAPAAEAEAQNIMTGESIYNLEGEEIGTIEMVNVDADGNQQAVISVGEFLGLGGKQVLIPASELSPREGGGYSVDYTQEQLEQMPAYEAG